MGQNATTAMSTHDATTTLLHPPGAFEVWADVKTPGDGRVYCVGSANVFRMSSSPTFSNVIIEPEPDAPNGKWTVVLQCTTVQGDIVWQRFLYGSTPGLAESIRGLRGLNARAISVWVGPTSTATRIAICGETYDDTLLASQDAAGWQQPFLNTATPDPTGFLAVYDGDGILQWTHHLFGVPGTGTNFPDCAITDVSMRVEQRDQELVDVVTWCGISSHGNPAGGNAYLTPVRPFQGPGSSGDVDHGPGQWDGIVGRVSRKQNDTNQATEFLSIVGGSGTDGLFGIAELDDQRFVVVGCSANDDGVVDFPFTTGPWTVAGSHRVGVVAVFDASATGMPTPTGPLVLESAGRIGSFGDDVSTVARDVIAQLRAMPFPPGPAPTVDSIYLVGQTNDADFLLSGDVRALVGTPGLDVLRGPSDGFLVHMEGVVGAGVPVLRQAILLGGDGDDGLTGIGAWNEYPDHVAVYGFRDGYATGTQLEVATCFLDTTVLDQPGPPVPPLLRLRHTVFGGTGGEEPAAMGGRNACDPSFGLLFATGFGSASGLGGAQGGGVAVDARGRVTIVGATLSTDYPVQDFSPPSAISPARVLRGGKDGVRTEIDMLPALVGRTDGTGSSGVPGFVPVPGFTGGTTPACALSAVGLRPDGPTPLLRRMLVDIEGDPDPATGSYLGLAPSILITRPPAPASSNLNVIGSLLQFTLPGNPFPPLLDPAGVEYWATDPGALLFLDLWTAPSRSFRKNFGSGTTPLGTVGVQMFVLLDSAVPGGTVPACTQPSSVAASPALWFPYF